MRHYKLRADQNAASGGLFTDLFVLKASDLTVATNDLLQNITLDTLNKGDVVYANTTAVVMAEFTPDPSADATVTVSVGRTSAGYVDILAASNLINAGTQIAVKVAYAAASTLAHQVIAADATALIAQFDITDTDGALATMTAGEVHIWMNISRHAERAQLGDV